MQGINSAINWSDAQGKLLNVMEYPARQKIC